MVLSGMVFTMSCIIYGLTDLSKFTTRHINCVGLHNLRVLSSAQNMSPFSGFFHTYFSVGSSSLFCFKQFSTEAVVQRCSVKTYSQKFHKICRKAPVPKSIFLKGCWPEACNFIKKETLAQMFSCGFCEISKNTFCSQNTSGGCFCQYMIVGCRQADLFFSWYFLRFG